MYTLSHRSRQRLVGVHSDLVSVVERAIDITQVDFTVLEGLRNPQKQKQLFDAGASRTMNSRHLTGHAVDLGAWLEGAVRWDWPLYFDIHNAMAIAASELAIPIEWGGHWKRFKDGPHYQLPWSEYPL